MNRPNIEEIEARLAHVDARYTDFESHGVSLAGYRPIDMYTSYGDVTYKSRVGGPRSSVIEECWGDGERVYFHYLPPRIADLFGHAPTDLADCIRYIRELEARVVERDGRIAVLTSLLPPEQSEGAYFTLQGWGTDAAAGALTPNTEKP